MKLYTDENITKPSCCIQTTRAKELKVRYYNSNEDIVYLHQIEDIANKLEINIKVFKRKGDSLELILDEGKFERTINLLYDQNHFIYIKNVEPLTFNSMVKCYECHKQYDYSHISRLHAHKLKHHSIQEKVLTFQKRLIKPSTTYFEKLFGKPLIHPIYFGFDFESVLHPLNEKKNKGTYLSEHIPALFVLQRNNGERWTRCGPNCAKEFIQLLDSLKEDIQKELKQIYHNEYKEDRRRIYKLHCKCKEWKDGKTVHTNCKAKKM